MCWRSPDLRREKVLGKPSDPPECLTRGKERGRSADDNDPGSQDESKQSSVQTKSILYQESRHDHREDRGGEYDGLVVSKRKPHHSYEEVVSKVRQSVEVIESLTFVVAEDEGVGQNSLNDQLQPRTPVTWSKYLDPPPDYYRQEQHNEHQASTHGMITEIFPVLRLTLGGVVARRRWTYSGVRPVW